MLLRNRFLYQKKQTKKLLTIIFIVFFLLCFCSLILIFNINQKTSFSHKGYYNFSGLLEDDNNYPLYTHSITSGGMTYFFRSLDVNLNEFSNKNVGVGVRFVEQKNNKNIFEVIFLKDFYANTIYFQKNIVFPSDLLLINTKEDENISAEKTGGKVAILYKKSPIFSIDMFFCNKIIEGYDCESIEKKIKETNSITFVSPMGYQFYKTSNETWYMLDKQNLIGYIVSTPNDDDFVKLSYSLNFLDKNYIAKNKKKIITNSCLEKGEYLTSIDEMKRSITDTKYFKFDFRLSYRLGQQKNQKEKQLLRSCGAVFNISSLSFWEG